MKEFIKIITLPTLWQATARLTTGLASLVLTALLTRNLGVENFGNFTKIFVLVAIFYLPADFGLNVTFVKLATAGQVKKLFFNLLAIRLSWSLILVGLSYFVGTTFYPGNTLVQILASATIFTTAVTITAMAFFQLRLNFFWQFIANLLSSFLTLFLIWKATSVTLTLTTVFGAILAGQITAAILNLGKVWLSLKTFFEKVDFLLIKKYFLASFPIGLTLIFNLLYFKADLIILSFLKPASSVGFYGLAVRVFEWAILPPVFLLNSAFPILAKAYLTDLEKFEKLYKISAVILLILGILVFLPLFFFPVTFINFIGGENFSQGAVALRILATGIPIFYLTGLLMWLLVILEKQLVLVKIYGGGAVFNIIVNLIFIPKFDFLAAAIITVIAEGLILLLSLIFFLRFRLLKNSHEA